MTNTPSLVVRQANTPHGTASLQCLRRPQGEAMTDEMSVPFDAFPAWVNQNAARSKSCSIAAVRDVGYVQGGVRKGVLTLDQGDCGSTIEVWSSGEVDMTMHDFTRKGHGVLKHATFETYGQLELILEDFFLQFLGLIG